MNGSTKKSVLTPIVLTVLGLGIAAIWYLRPQITAYLLISKLKHDNPELSFVPKSIAIKEIDQAPGTSVSAFGYTFEVPWGEVEQTENLKLGSRIKFKSGQVILFMDPSNELTDLAMLKQSAEARGLSVTALYGPDASHSYQLLKAIYETTPERSSLLQSRNQAIRDMVFLTMKSAYMDRSGTDTFVVETERWRGFQHHLPPTDRFVILKLFSRNDQQVTVWVGSKDKTVSVTQPQINRIVQTLRPLGS